ncbi:MAG: PEP/pyruvate-binding domain-containing protein [Candidatus Omnitrophota bacterium]
MSEDTVTNSVNIEKLLKNLQERRKELDCLYRIEELLHKENEMGLEELFASIIKIIPSGWQFPDIAQIKLTYRGVVYKSPGYLKPFCWQSTEIKMYDKAVGELVISYSQEVPPSGEAYFLKEEKQLIKAIADRISHILLHRESKRVYNQWKDAEEKLASKSLSEWRVIIDVLQKSNLKLFMYLSQKMLYYLCWNGVAEAKQLLQHAGFNIVGVTSSSLPFEDMNQPSPKQSMDNIIIVNNEIFRIASENLGEEQILHLIRRWMEQNKSRFLVKILESPNSSLTDLLNSISRFRLLEEEGLKLSEPIDKSLRVAMIRHLLSDQLEFIQIAKNFIGISDYYDLFKRIIFPTGSHGKIGGKSAGIFLASRIMAHSETHKDLFSKIKVPKTWYVTSDAISDFLHYNNLENVLEQKYKELDEIHVEYPNIIQIFKNSHFSPEIIRGLSIALDDFGDVPIIVRSSSLLEDRLGAAFSGKYKSLFLANQGTKEERLEALTDAIAEVYASTFAPDPIEYRNERGLLDFDEEMGILIQEVVGNRVGNYYFPTFAGVAFSKNEFRWSARINREDGLIRLVPGLGTRAVDRLSNDYPTLIAPGKPNLRVNVTPDEIIRYSPKHMDVINLTTNTFETAEIQELIKHFGNDIPGIHHTVSIVRDDNVIQKPTSPLNIHFDKDMLVVTFEGLFQRTDFIKQIGALLEALEKSIGSPVDIEFAHDGQNLYLLQCRPQSYSHDTQPAPIPRDIQEHKIAFTAERYISNGHVPDITHVVYVVPEAYSQLTDPTEMKTIGKAVGKLNKILPKRQFILMGPGRWGSRGDIRLGVDVSYSDLNNTAVLVEIARQKGNYVPELSFGTHFFQDLVEASIRYIPLYPDDPGIIFNEAFFMQSENILSDLLPEFAHLSHVLRVIDVPRSSDGLILRVAMNAELDQAIGVFETPGRRICDQVEKESIASRPHDDFWRWRYYMAERIAERLDMDRFGVKGIYLFGSTKNATCGPASDIDLLVHFEGSEDQRRSLMLWFEGWSLTLGELNYQRTGYKTNGLLDIHLVTDGDIEKKTSYALKIGAVTDAARPLKVKNT